MAMREKKMRMAMSNIAYGPAYGKITKMLMAIRYFAHGHELFCSWPCAIFLMAMRYFAHGHALKYTWQDYVSVWQDRSAITHGQLGYILTKHVCIWPYAK